MDMLRRLISCRIIIIIIIKKKGFLRKLASYTLVPNLTQWQ